MGPDVIGRSDHELQSGRADGVGRSEAGPRSFLFRLPAPEAVLPVGAGVRAALQAYGAPLANGPRRGFPAGAGLGAFGGRREEQLGLAAAETVGHPVLLRPARRQGWEEVRSGCVHADDARNRPEHTV